MYWPPTSSMARVVSHTTNATQAMKMNITFCISPMPKSENVSGISAATGMLRPNKVSGMKKACTRRKAAAEHAQRHADQRGQAETQRQPPQRGQQVARERSIKPQTGKAREGLRRAR